MSAVADAPDEDVTWRRVHKATPLLDTWKAIVAIVGFLTVRNAQEISRAVRSLDLHVSAWLVVGVLLGSLAVVAVAVGVFSYVSWRFRAYAVTPEAVYERRGILFRQHRSARLTRVQAVDVVRPLLGRLLGLGRLRVETAGGGDSGLTIGFLRDEDLTALRNEILARAAGIDVDGATPGTVPDGATASGPDVPPADATRREDLVATAPDSLHLPSAGLRPSLVEAPETVLYQVAPATLIGSLLRSGPFAVFGLVTLAVVVLGGLMLAGVLGEAAREGGVSFWFGALPGILGWGTWAWNRLAGEYGFTAAASPDGLRLRHGLLETRSQTLPPGRVHAVRLRQPLLWRGRDWWRVTAVVAGYGVRDDDARNLLRDTSLLPVGSRDAALRALWLVMPDLGVDRPDALMAALMSGSGPADGLVVASRRARWFHWLTWRRKAVAITRTGLFVRGGRVSRTVTVVPHERGQSHTLRQGPVGRLLRLGMVRVDIVPGSFEVRAGGLDADAAAEVWRAESGLARQRRRAEGPEAWLRRVVGP